MTSESQTRYGSATSPGGARHGRVRRCRSYQASSAPAGGESRDGASGVTDTGERDRFLGGPRPLGALIPRLTRPAFRRKSPAGAQIMADWADLVGPALAAVTTPRRLSAGTLTLGCSGPIALELAHLAPQLVQRINAHLGRAAVERLRFVQQAAALPAGAARRAPPVAVPERVRAALSTVPGEGLREALARLGQGVYRKR